MYKIVPDNRHILAQETFKTLIVENTNLNINTYYETFPVVILKGLKGKKKKKTYSTLDSYKHLLHVKGLYSH